MIAHLDRSVAVRAKVTFKGRVQGVFFRANCTDNARNLGLSGYVRNLSNGDVEAVFEGERETVEEAIRWNKKGQPHARVTEANVEWGEATGEFNGFFRR